MSSVVLNEGMIEALFIFIIITAPFIITQRNLLSVVSVYRLQSLLIFVVGLILYLHSGNYTTLSLVIIVLISKVFAIPIFIQKIQKRLNIKRDAEFNYLSPSTAIFASIFIIVLVYISLSKILQDLALSNLFFTGAVTGLSLAMIGMIVIFTRKQTILNIIGYLVMENGVLIIGLFLAELPFIIEFLIMIDLFMIVLLAATLSLGANLTVEDFHENINRPLNKWRFSIEEESEEQQ